jgi:hypothetical protein
MGSWSTSGTKNSRKGEHAIPVSYNTISEERCVGRIVSASETDGMAISYLSQLLDCVPSCEDDDNPYLVYSPEISIKDSSQPFRAFLGAILSVVKGVPVESSAYSPDMGLDTIEEDKDNIADGSGLYQGNSSRGAATDFPRTHSCAHNSHESTESELMVHPFLDRYLPLGSLISRLLCLLPNHLKTYTYGYISIPC